MNPWIRRSPVCGFAASRIKILLSVPNKIGVGRPVFRSGPPPSEPDRRFSRIRLSSQWAPFEDRLAAALAVVIVNNPSFAEK